jgi:hypothetical protein
MSYKILIPTVLLNLSSAAYATDNPGMSHSTLSSGSSKSISNYQSENDLPNKTLNSTDTYQHCFKNSTWVVPPQTLLAYLYDNANTTPVSDQTVWVISSYNQGYFTGQSYTAIDNSILSQKYLIGSVTSEGKVLITFYSGSSTNTSLISGIGNLNVKSSGQCTFIMQMNSGQNGVSGLTHWSYMIPVNPGDVFYNNLPGTNMSVPQFLSQF